MAGYDINMSQEPMCILLNSIHISIIIAIELFLYQTKISHKTIDHSPNRTKHEEKRRIDVTNTPRIISHRSCMVSLHADSYSCAKSFELLYSIITIK